MDVEKLRKSLIKLAAAVPGVVKEPTVELLAVAIKTDHLVLRLRFWIEDLLKKDLVQSEIIEKTFKKLADDDLLPTSDSK